LAVIVAGFDSIALAVTLDRRIQMFSATESPAVIREMPERPFSA
jgi:hypothetical protein